jgi:hypothetical protein
MGIHQFLGIRRPFTYREVARFGRSPGYAQTPRGFMYTLRDLMYATPMARPKANPLVGMLFYPAATNVQLTSVRSEWRTRGYRRDRKRMYPPASRSLAGYRGVR